MKIRFIKKRSYAYYTHTYTRERTVYTYTEIYTHNNSGTKSYGIIMTYTMGNSLIVLLRHSRKSWVREAQNVLLYHIA